MARCREQSRSQGAGEQRTVKSAPPQELEVVEALFGKARTNFVVLDPHCNIVRANDAFARRVGLVAAELPGRRLEEVLPDEVMLGRLDEAVRTRRPSTVSTRTCRPGCPERLEPCDCDWSIAPILDEAGELNFLFLSGVDVTDLRRTDDMPKVGETVYRSVFTSMNEGVVYQTADGSIAAANPAAERILGLSLSEMLGLTPRSPQWRSLKEDGTPFPTEQLPSMVSLRTGKPQVDVVMSFRQPDGGLRWISGSSEPLMDPGETSPHGVVSTFHDITGRKADEQRRMHMIHELNHRVKNTLATVQSIAAHTLKASPSPEAFAEAFGARILALAHIHDVLSRNDWTGAPARELVTEQLRPLKDRGAGRIQMSGPDIRLPPKMAVALSLALGELATNAVRHGALSVDHGRVSVNWKRETSGGVPRLRLAWREQGGPKVQAPARRGLGARLIERGLAHELGGSAHITFDPGGVTCEMEIPIPGDAP
jgi:PAS domain S-box-containing protein